MENQDPNQNTIQESSNSRAVELLNDYLKTSSSTKTAFSFLKVLAILCLASYIWTNIAESSLQFTFPIVILLYIVFVFCKVIIKENDSRLKNTDSFAKMLQIQVLELNELELEVEKYKDAFKNSKQVVLEWEKAHSYLAAQNSNLIENHSKLQESYDMVSARLSQAEKALSSHKAEKENFQTIIKKEKTDAYVLAIKEYDELITLNRSIPQLKKDEEKKAFAEARQKELEERINKAKAMSEKQ